MELGARIRQARLYAGLSQRQLCEDHITRNMLSQIENGAARPSMDTLRYLASRLGKPVSFFLEEETASANQALMQQAKDSYAQGDFEQTLVILEGYESPDDIFDAEMILLKVLATMEKAAQALAQGKVPFAATLLQNMDTASIYFTPDLQRKRLLLLAQAQPSSVCQLAKELPSDDAALLLRAKAALEEKDGKTALQQLEAVLEKTEQWHFLMGEAHYALGEFAVAAEHYKHVEQQALSQLERCYEQQGDYKMAYHYAKLQR